jgi:type 1 glutamine amidotransferase
LSVRNLILSGGPAHPFPATSACVADTLADEGIVSEVTDDIEDGLAALAGGGYRLLTVNALRWRMAVDRYAADRERLGFSLSAAGREAIDGHLAGGGGLLALHAAPICFDDWAGWGDIVGAHWVWGVSRHPALGPARMTVRSHAHEIVAGLSDFDVIDEVYGFLSVRSDVTPLMTAAFEEVEHPLLWARGVGGGRVVYDALGHDRRSFENPAHATILRRAAGWLVEVPCVR